MADLDKWAEHFKYVITKEATVAILADLVQQVREECARRCEDPTDKYADDWPTELQNAAYRYAFHLARAIRQPADTPTQETQQ